MISSAKKPIQTGLASYGMSGRVFHAPFLSVNPHFKLTKVLERTHQRAKESYPEVEIVRTFENLLEDEAIELVIVNTPNALHYEMAKKALLAGKHVVLEKPFTTTIQQANELIELAQKKNRVLTVFQNRRWDGDFRTVQQVVSEKMTGQLVEYEAHYDRYVPHRPANTWKEQAGPASGILYNLGSHMIDQALVLFGRPEAITANVGKQRSASEIDDYYAITLQYPELKVILKSSYLVREPGPRYVLHGTEGSFVKYGIDPQEEALKAGQKPIGEDWGKEPPSDWGTLNSQLHGLHFTGAIETLPGYYAQFYDNLYGAIREEKELAVKPEEAAFVIKIIELALQSSEQQRTIEIS